MSNEFLFQIDKLKTTISSVQGICQKKTIFDETQNIIFSFSQKENSIKAFDGEVSSEIYLDEFLDKYTNEEKSFSINGKRFFEIIKDLSEDEVNLAVKEKNIIISSSFSKIDLSTSIINTTQSSFMNNDVENIFSIKKIFLIEMISFCTPLATATNPTVNGTIFFEISETNISATSTDGHSLAHINFCLNNYSNKTFSFSISKKSSLELKRILDLCEDEAEIIVGKAKSEMIFSNKKFTIYIKTLVDKFPNYKQVIQTTMHKKFSFEKTSLLTCLKRLNCMTAGRFIPARIKQKEPEKFLFNLENKEIGSIYEEIKTNEEKNQEADLKNFPEEIEVSVYPPYFFQGATTISNHNFDSKNIFVFFASSKKPLIIEHIDQEKQLLYVIMPMIST